MPQMPVVTSEAILIHSERRQEKTLTKVCFSWEPKAGKK